METIILFKVLLYIGTVLGFVFAFLDYIVVRPNLASMTTDYNLGLIEGGLIAFIFTALPLTYAYFKEKEKKKRKTIKPYIS